MGLLTSFRVAVAPLRLVDALRRRRVPSPCPAIASATADLAIFFVFFSGNVIDQAVTTERRDTSQRHVCRGCLALLDLRSALLTLTSLRSCRIPSPCPAIASATADLFFCLFSRFP